MRQGRQRHHRLEDAARRIDPGNGTVQQGVAGVALQPVPGVVRDRRAHLVGVEGRQAGHRQDVAVARIEDHPRRTVFREQALELLLQREVDREAQILPRDGRPVGRAVLVAGDVHGDKLPAGRAGQTGVNRLLEARASAHAHDVVVEDLVGHNRPVTADIAEQVRGQRAVRVAALGLNVDVEARRVRGILREARQRSRVDPLPGQQRQGEALVDVLLDVVAGDLPRHAEIGGHAVDLRVDGIDRVAPAPRTAQFLEVDGDAVVGTVVGQADAMAVEEASAGRRQQHAPDALAPLLARVDRRVAHLDAVQPEPQRQETGQHQQADAEQAPARHLFEVIRHGTQPPCWA